MFDKKKGLEKNALPVLHMDAISNVKDSNYVILQ